jgi:hypothetical protein
VEPQALGHSSSYHSLLAVPWHQLCEVVEKAKADVHRKEMLGHLDSDERIGGQDHWWHHWDWWELASAGMMLAELEGLVSSWKQEAAEGR